MILEAVLIAAIVLLVYTWGVYPAIVLYFPFPGKASARGAACPPVAVIVSAHNAAGYGTNSNGVIATPTR